MRVVADEASSSRLADVPRTLVSGMLRPLRHTPDRLLHPLRRMLARRRLREPPTTAVLFVCLGNICRSPYAAEAFRRLVPGRNLVIESAGLIGPGRPAPPKAIEVARLRGVELTAHRSRVIAKEGIAAADLIVVMDQQQARAIGRLAPDNPRVLVLGDLDPLPISTRTIADPYDRDAAAFAASYERIDRCLQALASELPGTDG